MHLGSWQPLGDPPGHSTYGTVWLLRGSYVLIEVLISLKNFGGIGFGNRLMLFGCERGGIWVWWGVLPPLPVCFGFVFMGLNSYLVFFTPEDFLAKSGWGLENMELHLSIILLIDLMSLVWLQQPTRLHFDKTIDFLNSPTTHPSFSFISLSCPMIVIFLNWELV